MFKDLQKALTFLPLFMMTACTTVAIDQHWPSDLPNKEIFVENYLSTRKLKTSEPSSLEAHLTWIVRFYEGTVLYPTGWNKVSERFLASIEGERNQKLMAERLRSLGILIANEWAQDNNIRKINSSNVAVWGSALRTSADQNDQLNYVAKVEQDVQALISGSLQSSEISYERYYPSEDYDDF